MRKQEESPERPEDQSDYMRGDISASMISQCAACRNNHPGEPTCEAFPEDGIPIEILTNDFDHREQHPGDNGLKFEPREGQQSPFIIDA